MQLDEYCVIMLYIRICCTWTIPKYISLNDTVIGSLFIK